MCTKLKVRYFVLVMVNVITIFTFVGRKLKVKLYQTMLLDDTQTTHRNQKYTWHENVVCVLNSVVTCNSKDNNYNCYYKCINTIDPTFKHSISWLGCIFVNLTYLKYIIVTI